MGQTTGADRERSAEPPALQISSAVESAVGDPLPDPTSRLERPRATARVIAQNADQELIEQRLRAILDRRLVPRSTADSRQRVYDLYRDNRIIATMIFDRRQSGVLVEASVAVIDQLAILFDELGRPARDRQRPSTVLSIERTDRQKLQEAIDAYRRSSQDGLGDRSSSNALPTTRALYTGRRAKSRADGLALVNFVLQGDADADTHVDANRSEPVGVDGRPVQDHGGLDLDVDVQTLPDLDVVILRGRDRDVRRLTQIIQELERLSRETQPNVQVYNLQHVNSDAVAEVLQEVSEDLTGRRQGRVNVTSLSQPNAILLIGWGDAVQAMLELIRQLDSPTTADAAFRVYRLRHAPATEVASTVSQFYANRNRLGPRVQALADRRSNAVIVNAAPRDIAEVDQLIRSLDTAESRAVKRATIVPLRHSLATDIADTLRTAIQSEGDQAAPSAILEMLTVDAEGERLIRSGILTDVRITENVRNNSLILSGPPESVPLLRQLIEQLDVPASVSQIKVFRVENGDATSLVRMLRSLLPSEAPSASASALTPRLPDAEGETSLAPLRFSVDSRTNSIIATGSEGDLRIVEALLLRLDERDLAERKTEVYRLRNSPALDVATAVNEFLRSERIVQSATPGRESPFEQIEREVVVVPEPIGNSLIISATPRYFDEIRSLVEKLDEPPPQVMIQVLIAEVTLNNAHEFGVELGLQDSVLFDRSLLGDLVTTVNSTSVSTPAGVVTSTEEVVRAATNVPGFAFNNQSPGNSGSNASLASSNRVGGQGLASFAVGRMNNELGFGGLVLSASSESVSVLIRALEESRRLDVLSRPQVRTLDNQPAFIQVGQRVPRIVASNITDGGLQTNSVELENVGLIMGVTPRISPDGTVVMEIDAEKSSLGAEQDGIPITVSADGTIIRAPRIDTTTAQATVSAASGETIVLGGLITKSNLEVHRTVPYLSRLPVLGDLFRFDSTVQKRSELLIILTPHVIRSPEDSERLKQAEMARMSWCAADIYEVHGDVQSSLQLAPLFDEPTQVIYPHVDPRGDGDATTPGEPAAPEPDRAFGDRFE